MTPLERCDRKFRELLRPTKNEATRMAVNQWIPDEQGVRRRDRLRRRDARPESSHAASGGWASMDHLHPNDAGYEAMAKAVDLSLFSPASRRVAAVR